MHRFRSIYAPLGICLLVFCLSMLGIFSRPMGLLAAFWPANAVLLGLFVRHAGLARPLNWLTAVIGYVIADLLTGTPLALSLFLTAGNLVGIGTGYVLYRRLPPAQRFLKQPLSVMYLVGICLAAALMAGLVGMAGYPFFFHGSPLHGFSYWFVTELMNFIAILPVILTAPTFTWKWRTNRRQQTPRLFLMNRWLPILSLLSGGLLGWLIGGPGALSFLMPGLIWCALSYSLFITALLTLLSSMWVLLATASGVLDLGVSMREIYTLDSFRLGVTLTSLAPLAIASVMSARNALIAKLQHNATHDPLTHALNRFGFLQRSRETLASGRAMTVLMIDVDHFKHINDNYGHASGDLVLTALAKLIRRSLRADDVFGRLGGEEFCILCPESTLEGARAVAERIRDRCARHAFSTDKVAGLQVTISIGLAHVATSANLALESLLVRADEALYAAKQQGRNRVVVVDG